MLSVMVLSLSAVRRVAGEVAGPEVFRVVAVTGRGDSDYVEVVLRPRCDPSESGPVVIGTSRRTSEPRLRDVFSKLLREHLEQPAPC
jgi:hypothetical protein